MLELTVVWLLPFLSGMTYPGEYVTLIDWPVPGTITKPLVKSCPVLTTPTVVGVAHKAFAAAAVAVDNALLIVPAPDPATKTAKLTKYPAPVMIRVGAVTVAEVCVPSPLNVL
jgi:hypothetical protein